MLLGKLPALSDTQAGKDLIAIGFEIGFEIGFKMGVLIGTIITLQNVLGLEQTSDTELRKKSSEELTSLARELQSKVRSRLGTQ